MKTHFIWQWIGKCCVRECERDGARGKPNRGREGKGRKKETIVGMGSASTATKILLCHCPPKISWNSPQWLNSFSFHFLSYISNFSITVTDPYACRTKWKWTQSVKCSCVKLTFCLSHSNVEIQSYCETNNPLIIGLGKINERIENHCEMRRIFISPKLLDKLITW